MAKRKPRPDLLVSFHGSLCLVTPQSPEALRWLEDSVSQEATWWGSHERPALVVEPRYIVDLIEGLQAEGLTVAR